LTKTHPRLNKIRGNAYLDLDLVLKFSEFPNGCVTYNGHHSLSCYKTIFEEVGCFTEGFDWPDKLTLAELSLLSDKNLRYLWILHMETHISV